MRLLAATLAFLCLLTPAWAAPAFPALTGRVVDDAGILSSGTKADLTRKLAALEGATSRQLVIVTLPSLQGYEISDYGYRLGRAWGIGQKKLNNGILFIVAPKERKTRIEVGYGLEPIVTDAFSSVVIQTQVLPYFRKGDFNGGVVAGTDALIQQLSLETSEAERRAAAAEQQLRHRGNDDGGGGLIGFL
ncbi:MAG TPA: TPM domain-containing protein, partial [Rhizomicrobium sp.]|nr:TPM domain-containing protein [Rhizomicrobium sp.]